MMIGNIVQYKIARIVLIKLKKNKTITKKLKWLPQNWITAKMIALWLTETTSIKKHKTTAEKTNRNDFRY